MIYSVKIKLALVIIIFLLILATIIQVLPSKAQNISDTVTDLSGVTIYFSESHREPSRYDRSDSGISRFAGLLGLAGANLKTLDWRNGIPSDADLVVIAAPGDDIPVEDVVWLWNYLQKGGNLLLITDPIDRRGRFGNVLSGDGLFSVTWTEWGLQGNVDMLVRPDGTQTVDVVEQDRSGNVTFTFSGDVPILTTDFLTTLRPIKHPIIDALNSTTDANDSPANLTSFYWNGARSFQIDLSAAGTSTPLLFVTDPEIYGEVSYDRYQSNGYSEYTIGEDNPPGNLILALAFEAQSTGSRAVMVGDGDFVINGGGFITSPSYSSSFVYPLNVQFMMDSVAWLLDKDVVRLDLPTPAATSTATVTPTATMAASATPTPTN